MRTIDETGMCEELQYPDELSVHRKYYENLERRIDMQFKSYRQLCRLAHGLLTYIEEKNDPRHTRTAYDSLLNSIAKIKEDIDVLVRTRENYKSTHALASFYTFCDKERKFKSTVMFEKDTI